jgi:F-box protein 3
MQSPAKRRPRLGHATPSALENLPPVALARVIARAGPRGAASLACASKTLRAAASSEERWRRFCADDIGIDAPVDPEGRVLPSFKVLSDGCGFLSSSIIARTMSFLKSEY